jgi:hypothetical protein
MATKMTLNHNLLVGLNVRADIEMSAATRDLVRDNVIMIAFQAERGPINVPIVINSLSNGTPCYGFPAADLIYNGWASRHLLAPQMICVRVAGAGAQKASLTIKDSSDNDAWVFEAVTEGEDGNNIAVKVTAGAESDNVMNPDGPPTLIKASTGGTIPAGTYRFKFSYLNANGETLVSPEGIITVTGTTSKVTIKAPLGIVYGADRIKGYVLDGATWLDVGESASLSDSLVVTSIPETGDAPVNTNTATVGTRTIELWYKGIAALKFENVRMIDAYVTEFNKKNPWVKLTVLPALSEIPDHLPSVMTSALYLGGGFSDNDSVDASDIVGTINEETGTTGLKVFEDSVRFRNGYMLAPGWDDDIVQEELENQADKYFRVAIMDNAIDSTLNDIKTWAETGNINNFHCIAPFPCGRAWHNPDFRNGIGPERCWLPTSIDMAGAGHKAAVQFYPFRAPAGTDFVLPLCPAGNGSNLIGGLYKDAKGNNLIPNQTVLTELGDKYGIISIMQYPGQGPMIYDTVTRSTDELMTLLPHTLVLNTIFYLIQDNFNNRDNKIMFQSLHSGNLEKVFDMIEAKLSMVMQRIQDMGGVVGTDGNWLSEDGGWVVKLNDENNQLYTLQDNIIRVDIFYRNVPVVRKIDIHIKPRGLTDTLE